MTEQTKEVQAKNSVVPHVDIVESEDNVTIMADMPGVDENSIDITLEKNVLSVSGSVEFSSPDNFTPPTQNLKPIPTSETSPFPTILTGITFRQQ